MSLGFKLGDRIGKGSFATVYKGQSASSGAAVAVKVVHRAHLKRDRRLLDNFEGEMAILKQMKHPHIVLLHDVAQTQDDFFLVMEYCSLGDLSYLIRKRQQLCKSLPLVASLYERYPATAAGGLDETVIRHFLCQLSAALKFLRSVNLVHRDIKPQNLLLMPPLSEQEAKDQGIDGLWELPILKVADFGFARFLPSTSMAETLCGSPLYMAPEILNYEKYNAKADLWSVGAVVYEMVASKPPFPASNHMDLIKKINQGRDKIAFPAGAEISSDLQLLIQGLLKKSPTERMGFDEFFSHPALKVLGKQESLNMENLDGNLYISEYLTGTIGARGLSSPNTLSPMSSQSSSKFSPKTSSPKTSSLNRYGVDSNPFSSSNESLGDLKTLTTKAAKKPAVAAAAAAKGMGSSMDDYVVVEKRTVEVNVLADEIKKEPKPGAAFTRRRLSSITYGTSPTNALAQALIKSSARLFGARVESGTISIPQDASIDIPGLANRIRSSSFSPGSERSTEDKLTQTLDRLNRMGRVVTVFAELKHSQLHPEDETQDPTIQDIIAQEALALYLKALGILARAMEIAAQWWAQNNEGTTVSQVLKDVVQSIRSQFNDCIDKAEVARTCILNGDRVSAPLASVEKLLFERALELARSAAGQELSDDLAACEMNYATALWMLRAIVETGTDPGLGTEDHELVERLSSRVQQRILALRRRIESMLHISPGHTP